MKKTLLFISLLSFALFSCKKDGDTEFPVITWNSPANGIQISVYDTLHVSLHITDNNDLTHLDVKLLDMQQSLVGGSVSFPLNGKSQDIFFDFPVDNIRLATGSYYLDAEVFDGYNLARSYIVVNITAVPRAFKGFFAATFTTPNSLKIYKTDTSWLPSLFSGNQSDFTDMEVSSYWQQVYSAGSYTGDLRAISIDGLTPGWSIHPYVSANPYWGPLSVKDSRLWVSYRGDNRLRYLDETGAMRANNDGDIGFHPILSLQVGNRVFSEQKDNTSSAEKMVAYSIYGGGLQETILGMSAVGMFEKDADNVYVVGNNAGQGHLMIYDFTSNGMWEPIILPAGTVTSAAQVDTNTLLIGMNTGTIYKFTYAPVGLLTWTVGVNATQLRFNDVDGEVLSAEGTNVKIYNYNPFSLTRTIAIPDSVKDLEVWYNR
jgi:hypothetical protein